MEGAEDAATRDKVVELLTKTARLEEAQKHIQKSVAGVEEDIRNIEGEVRTISKDVGDNKATLVKNTAMLESIDRRLDTLLNRTGE